MRIAICDDAPIIVGSLDAMLKQYAQEHLDEQFVIHSFSCAENLIRELSQSPQGYDLYLLDIIMEGRNGIELAQVLRQNGCRSSIVFLTSSPDYALPAFSVKAQAYLIKPVNPKELFSILDDVVESYALRRGIGRLSHSFRTPEGFFTTDIHEIIYVEVMGHTPYYHLADRTIRGSEMRLSFEQSMSELLKAGCFIRPHRSYLVNASHIVSIGTASLTLDNKASIPLARNRVADTKKAYLAYQASASLQL